MVRLGQGSYVGLGVVTPYSTVGTNADITQYFQVVGGFDSLQLERDILEFDDLTANWKDDNLLVGGQRRVTGSITLRVFYDELQDVLRMLTGHNVAVSGSGPYTYAFVPLTKTDSSHYWLGSTDRAYCIELYRGGGVANSVFYQGCEITEFRMSFNPNAFVDMQISFIGRGYTIGAKTATPSYPTAPVFTPTGQPFATKEFLDLGGTSYKVRGAASIVVTNAVDFNFDISAIETDIPLPTGKDTCVVEAEVEVDDDTLLNILDDPEGSRFSGGNILVENQTSTHSIRFDINQGVLMSPAESRPQNQGIQLARVQVEAWAPDAVTSSWTATLVNGDAAYVDP